MNVLGSRALAAAVAVGILAGCENSTRQVSEGESGSYEASLAVRKDGFVVTWHDHRDGNAEIYARLLDARGRPAGPERRLTRSLAPSFEADVVVAADELVVAWYEVIGEGRSEARLGRWRPDGSERWVRTLSGADRNGRNPLVRVAGDRLFCAWLEGEGDDIAVWSRWFDLDGRPLSPPERLASAGPTTWNLGAEVAEDGRVWVVFDATAGTRADELFMVGIEGGQIATDLLTEDDGVASKYPDIALHGDRVALTWYDELDGNREVYLAVGVSRAIREGLSRLATRVTATPGESIGAYVDWNADRVGLAWSDEVDGQHEVFFQSFDLDGRPVREARRLTRNETASLIPSIQPWAGGFALAWNEDVIGMRGSHGGGGRSDVAFTLVR